MREGTRRARRRTEQLDALEDAALFQEPTGGWEFGCQGSPPPARRVSGTASCCTPDVAMNDPLDLIGGRPQRDDGW